MAAEEDPSTTDYGNSTEDDRTLMSSHQIKMEVDDKIVPVDSKAEQITDEILRKIKIEEDLLIKEEISVKEEKFDVKAVKQEIPEVDHKLSARVTVDLVPIKRGELNIKVEKNKNEPQVYPDPGEEVEESILPEPSRSETPQENSVKKLKRIVSTSSPQRLCREESTTATGLSETDIRSEDDDSEGTERDPSSSCFGTVFCQCVHCLEESHKKIPHRVKSKRKYLFSCDICNKKLKNATSLKLHKESKCGTMKLITCEICGKGIGTNKYFGHVINVHHRSPFLEQTCGFCQKVFPYLACLKDHIRRMHSLELFKCEQCSKVFKNKRSLKTHIRGGHMNSRDLDTSLTSWQVPSGVKTKRKYLFSCDVCNKKCLDATRLKLHKESKCGTIETLFTCEFCGKGIRKKYFIKHVTDVHLKGPLLEQTCGLCQKVFPNLACLKDHTKRMHSSELLKCEKCSKVFKNKKILKSHIQREHMKSKYLSTVPSSCTTKGSPQTSNSKKDVVMCEVCGKVLVNKNSLARHRLTHTGEKSVVCDVCGKSFRTESNLYQHSRTHSDERSFSCDLCDKSFRIKHHLRQHMAVHGMANTSVKRRKVK